MAGLKEIRIRIASVTSTRQITSAMKMVAAAKLKKSQDKVLQIRPYARKMQSILAEVAAGLRADKGGPYTQLRPVEKVLVVLLASNRGLCGGFNSNVCKKAMQHVADNYSQQAAKGNVSFVTIGKKAGDFITKNGFTIVKSGDEVYDNLTFAHVTGYTNFLMQAFVDGTFDRIDVVYNSFKNAAVNTPLVEQFLPMPVVATDNRHPSDYIFEPNIEHIVKDVIPKSLRIQFHRMVLDSFAAENGARMTAMHQATDNATELINDLTLQYNKARQSSITNEILEITGGAEALKT